MRGSAGCRSGEVVTGSWRSLTGGGTWRCRLAVSVGGPRWRCRLWRCGIEPGLIGTLRCGNRQGPVGVSWSLTVGALWLALSGWRRKPGGVSWRNNLADLVGGPRWRWRPVVVQERAATDQHPSMRGSPGSRRGELVTDSWRSLVGGATWRCQLADLGGGVGPWRCRPVAVRVRAPTDRHASMRGSAGYRSGETVTGSWRSLVSAL